MVISLTNSQQKAFDALKHGKNVFLTGGAGTGKTTLIKEFIKEVDPHCEHTLLCAPTGKAALNMSIETPEGTVTGRTKRQTPKETLLYNFRWQICRRIMGCIARKSTNKLLVEVC